MDNVVPLGNITKLDLPTDRILDAAKSHCTEGVVILGFDDDGSFYFASSIAAGDTVLWLMEVAKKELLEIGEADIC